jgi:alkane 1-monooxygenase
MRLVIPYSLVFLPLLTLLLGLLWGGVWTWSTLLLVFVVLPFLDLFCGVEQANPEPGELGPAAHWVARGLLWALTPALLVLTLVAVWQAAARGLPTWDLVGLILSAGVASGGLGITAAHELIHKTNSFERFLGQALLLNACYMHFYIEHLIGHHSRVATPEDPASSRFGESLYAFLPRTIVGGVRSAWELEAQRLGRAGLSVWSLRNRMWAFMGLPWLVAAVLSVIWGPMAGLFFLAQGAVAVVLLEVVNYVEHYGLAREPLPGGRYERVTQFHSWSCANRLSNWITFQLQRHADHHTHPVRRYEDLQFDPAGPSLPTGYPGMIWLAVIPPLWRHVMDPKVEQVRQQAK